MRALALLLLLAPATAAAQELVIPPVRYPSLPVAAADAAGFAPRGWGVERQARGDLNGDGSADLAFVLRMRDPANILTHDGLGNNPFDTNPRVLGVALAAPGGGFRLVAQNHSLIPRRDMPTQEDPFGDFAEGIAISRGTLRVGLYQFMNAGGWDAGPISFAFRWQEGALRLIGFDSNNLSRNSGCLTMLSINYLTRRARLSVGNIANDRDRVRWRTIPARPLATIEGIGDGMTFDPDGLVSAFPLHCPG